MSHEQTVLIVDDEALAREGLELALEDEPCRVLTAGSAAKALKILAKENIHLVLTDLKMPDMDGIELLKRIKEESPDVDVVMVTGFATVDTAVQAMRLGALEYICKPFKLDDVRRTVRLALEQQRLAAENRRLREELLATKFPKFIVTESPKMAEILELVTRVAPSKSNVLITGESGVGKELIARTIHCQSPRVDNRFLPFNCAARAESLLESELFGYEKGAFTGADKRKEGIFEAADGGTVFLDEIGEIPLPLQVKLLRVIYERELMRLGGDSTIEVDFRLIAATNRNLEKEVGEGRFREDLFYRLNVITIEVPPLRQRTEDILPLARQFLEDYSREEAKSFNGFSAEAEDLLISYGWPGNVRELQNVVERAVILTKGKKISASDLQLKQKSGDQKSEREMVSLAENEKRHILQVMEQVSGNRSRAARILGMDRSSLWRKLKSYDVDDGED